MTDDTEKRSKNMILGALVADAAAMGLHWIYDQAHIRSLAPDRPEFQTPNADDYANVAGYFAHAGRSVGDQSQYGEQTLVMLRLLQTTDGHFDVAQFQTAFQAHFGYGGAYVGYIDHATRTTLDNLRRAEDYAAAQAQAIPFDGDPSITKAMIGKANAVIKNQDRDSLRTRFEQAVRVTHDNDQIVAYGLKVLQEIIATPVARGADDVQLPALAKLPALIASLVHRDASSTEFSDIIETAIRTTNDNDTAVAYGQTAAQMMRAAAHGADVSAILDAGNFTATPAIAADLKSALHRTDRTVEDVTTQFGLACDLSYALPSVCYNIRTAPTFTEAIRRNIYAGGDTCGRAIVLGSILGAVHGVGGATGIPLDWIDTLSSQKDSAALR